MPLCKVCLENISVGQQMAVISLPVKNTAKSGDYDFLGDFTDNQEFIHHECLRQIASQLIEILYGDNPIIPKDSMSNKIVVKENPLFKEFSTAIKGLGDNPDKDEIKEFLDQNEGKDIPNLIKVWFRNRNKIAHAV
jgi:hypothetical protein